LRETDAGRPFNQLSSKVLDVDLEGVAQQVIDTGQPVEQEVKTTEGQVYLMRVLPYRYLKNQRPGAVLTFVNIKDLKGMAKQLQFVEDAWRFAEGIVGTVRHPLVILDPDMKIISANESFYRLFQLSGQAVAGRSFNDLGTGQLDIPELSKVLQEVMSKSQSFEDLQIECEFPEVGRQKFRLNARRIYERGIAKDRILLAMEQVTEKE